MPPRNKHPRQVRLRELLQRNHIESQEQLQELLAADGMVTTQATLSRDLRDLGATKGLNGYALPTRDPKTDDRELRTAVQRSVIACERSGTMVIFRTHPGQAGALAAEIQRAALREVVGIMANEDTLFVATRTLTDTRILARIIHRMIQR